MLSQYDLVVVDEFPQLSAENFDRVIEMWDAAGRVPGLVVLGDFWQLPNVDGSNVQSSPHWLPGSATIYKVDFHQVWRCSCPTLQAKLDALRTSKPDKQLLNTICRGHKAWTGHDAPTSLDIKGVFEKTGGATTFVTCTRRGAALVNRLAVQVLFEEQGKTLIATIPGDYDANPANYSPHGKAQADSTPKASDVPLYIGMRVVLTKNICKRNHFVNGMTATVEAFDPATGCVQVLTATKRRLAIFPYTDDHVGPLDEQGRHTGRLVYYPLRVGYAATIHKFQGATLDHITLWLDRPNCPAAGYVALSRVRRDSDYLIGGRVTRDHFTPAR